MGPCEYGWLSSCTSTQTVQGLDFFLFFCSIGLDSTMGELNLPNDLYGSTSDSVGLHYETNDNGMSLSDAVEAMMMQSLQSLSIHNPHHSSKIVQPSSSNSLCNGEQLVWPQPQDRNQVMVFFFWSKK